MDLALPNDFCFVTPLFFLRILAQQKFSVVHCIVLMATDLSFADACRESPFRRDTPSSATMRAPPRAASQCALQCAGSLSRSVASLDHYDNLSGGHNRYPDNAAHWDKTSRETVAPPQDDVTRDNDTKTDDPKVTPTKVRGDASVTVQQYWDYSKPILLQESCV